MEKSKPPKGWILRARKGAPFFLVIASLFFLSQTTNEMASVGEVIRKPRRSDTARLPEDVVIGPLGRGSAPVEAYRVALAALNAMLAGKEPEGVASLRAGLAADIKKNVLDIAPERYRIGGGRIEADGSVSFVFRFLAKGKDTAPLEADGELYLRQESAPQEVPQEALADAEPATAPVTEEEPKETAANADAAASPAVSDTRPIAVQVEEKAATAAAVTAGTGEWKLDDVQFVSREEMRQMNAAGASRVPYERFY